MGETRSRTIGAVLWRNIHLLFLGALLLSGTAADGADDTYTLDFFESVSSLDPPSSSCNLQTLFSLRSAWHDVGEVCNRKLPFEFWIYMKAEGSAEDPDADHVRKECLMLKDIGVVELTTPNDWDKTIINAASGKLLRETKQAASYIVQSPLDFEAMCADDQVTKVSRIIATTIKTHEFRPRNFKRHLRNTMNTAEIAHGVGALTSGLEELGCQRTAGEDQTLCIMSDSFNHFGSQFALQESGDLPPDDFLTIVEDLPLESGMGSDEGSSMTKLAYNIARGANFKFNTMFMGKVTAADDIRRLGTHRDKEGEGCDIIVDNISFGDEPGFRGSVISKAVEEVVAVGSLYFSAAGNTRNGYKFTSNWECTSDLFGGITSEPCDNGVASHVFNPEVTGIHRYLLPLDGTRLFPGGNTFFLHWNDDEGTSRSVVVELWTLLEVAGEEYTILARIEAVSDFGTVTASLTLPEGAAVSNHDACFKTMVDGVAYTSARKILHKDIDHHTKTAIVKWIRMMLPLATKSSQVGDLYYLTISQVYSDREDVEMRLMSWTDKIFSDCFDGSMFGHPCASSTITFSSWDSSGDGDAFADREAVSAEGCSSRKTHLKPVTTPATDLITSTERFATSEGTSVSAPVAAAITAIVRAACFPRMVTHSDMMEMLTNYTYTIDVTSDADGAKETWGAKAGHGIISADQMLGWITANCQESCPGSVTPSTPVTTLDTISHAIKAIESLV